MERIKNLHEIKDAITHDLANSEQIEALFNELLYLRAECDHYRELLEKAGILEPRKHTQAKESSPQGE